MNVPAEYGGDVPRKRGTRDHVRPAPEREVAGPAGRTLDAVVQAQEPHVRGRCVCARLREKRGEPIADLADVGEPGERHSDIAGFEHDRAWSIEDMDVAVEREEGVRDAAALVIPREEEDRDSLVGDPSKRPERSIREPRRNAAAIQEIAAVEEYVHLAGSGERERGLETLEEIASAARGDNSRPCRQALTEMGV